MLIKDLHELKLRCSVIQILSSILGNGQISKTCQSNLNICGEVFVGLTSSLKHADSDGYAEIALIELGLSSSEHLRDQKILEDFTFVLPVIALLRNKSTSVKLHISQTVR